MTLNLTLICEDKVHEAVVNRILDTFGDKFVLTRTYSRGGKSGIRKNILRYNEAAVNTRLPYLVVVDLDNGCPVEELKNWLEGKRKSKRLLLRFAAMEAESWLIADDANLAKFLGVSPSTVARLNPDTLMDPKGVIIELARKSRKRTMKGLIPPIGSICGQGPEYNVILEDFIMNHWDVGNAMHRSDSLSGAISALSKCL